MALIALLTLVILAMPRGPKRAPAVTTDDLLARRLLYPVAEAAELLGVHRTTLYTRHREGLIALVRVGGRTYVAADEIERYIAAAEPAHTVRSA
jgi:excisionase family DNA binding protein